MRRLSSKPCVSVGGVKAYMPLLSAQVRAFYFGLKQLLIRVMYSVEGYSRIYIP